MKELKLIVSRYNELKAKRQSCVLATVVYVEGSSYRRAGARMLVDEMGQMTGAISGGCLEGDALRKALLCLYQNKNKLITYDTSDEQDAVIGAQLGCDGVIQVLFEIIDFEMDLNPLELIKTALENSRPVVLVTLFDLSNKSSEQRGTKLLISEDKGIENSAFFYELRKDAQKVLIRKRSLFIKYQLEDGSQHAFLEFFSVNKQLVIAGAGYDGQILAEMAEVIGWNVVVVDGRSTHAKESRFAPSCQVIVANPELVLSKIDLSEETAIVLLTHNYNYDLALLKALLKEKKSPFYIGILGPKKKYDRMLNDLKKQEIVLTEGQLSMIHAPIGLEIGAETPEEIGLSILSEIQSVFTKTSAMKLKYKEGPIHQKKNNQFEIRKI